MRTTADGMLSLVGGEALFTDLYELTMLQSYVREGMDRTAVFSLYYRTRPPTRNYLIAAGLESVLQYLETLRFTEDDIAYLRSLGQFREDFLEYLSGFRFRGSVRAMPEGTPVFPEEPVLEIEASLPEAQLVETYLINQINFSTLIASKASRIVDAAAGRPVLDFGSRRAHGVDAGVKAARASYLAGLNATSNVLAGKVYGLPVAGTMAHSYVAACASEAEAYERFLDLYPRTTLLVDTYDTLVGVDHVVALARPLPAERRPAAIRIDSGDLAALATEARRRLDAAGLADIKIYASGGLDEHSVGRLVASGAPVDGFGVGTSLVTSSDAAQMDFSYKLSTYAGVDRVKLSSGKRHLPGPKQVFRRTVGGRLDRDVLARADERHDGEPLLAPVMAGGAVVDGAYENLDRIRERTAAARETLPPQLRSLEPTGAPFLPDVSERLAAEAERLRAQWSGG